MHRSNDWTFWCRFEALDLMLCGGLGIDSGGKDDMSDRIERLLIAVTDDLETSGTLAPGFVNGLRSLRSGFSAFARSRCGALRLLLLVPAGIWSHWLRLLPPE